MSIKILIPDHAVGRTQNRSRINDRKRRRPAARTYNELVTDEIKSWRACDGSVRIKRPAQVLLKKQGVLSDFFFWRRAGGHNTLMMTHSATSFQTQPPSGLRVSYCLHYWSWQGFSRDFDPGCFNELSQPSYSETLQSTCDVTAIPRQSSAV